MYLKASKKILKLQMQVQVPGYAYGATSEASRFAILILLIYVFIAISHVIYSVFYTGMTSSSWDTVSEIIVLALRSTSGRLEEHRCG